MSEVKALEGLLELILDDDYLMSFQRMGPYRAALANEVRRKLRGLERPPVKVGAKTKRHHYALTFKSGCEEKSVCIGSDFQSLTLADLSEARDSCRFSQRTEVLLLNSFYMGYMTEQEAQGEQRDE